MKNDDASSMAQHHSTLSVGNRSAIIVAAILLLAALLRLYNISANSFNLDEMWALWLVNHDALSIVRYTMPGGVDPSTPPVYYVLLRAFVYAGQDPFIVRLLSALAGTLMVWLTFRFALDLFDLRVALLSALLMAVAPLQITWSRVARSYMLAALLTSLSLYFFARLIFRKAGILCLLGMVCAMTLAVWTHYLAFLVIIYANAVMAVLWSQGRATRQMMGRWLVSQVVLAISVVPALVAAVVESSGSPEHIWTPSPGVGSLVKSAILFGTGDPSYGPSGMTLARLFSLLLLAGLLALGIWVFVRRGYHRRLDGEGERLLFLVGACVFPVGIGFIFSQVRPIYAEKYYLYLMPSLLILFSWVLTRARPMVFSLPMVSALALMVGSALYVYYTEPFGEQWREAVNHLRQDYRRGDAVVVIPGWYSRPFAYYFSGGFPPDAPTLERAPAAVFQDGDFRPLGQLVPVEATGVTDAVLASAERVWVVTGYAPVDPASLAWFKENFEPVGAGEFVGASVQLLQRIHGPLEGYDA